MTEPLVRLGTQEDMHDVMALMQGALDENAFRKPSIPKLATAVWGTLTRQNGIAGIATVDGTRVDGVILMTIGSMIYSDEEFLEERILYVHPEYRSMKYALAKKMTAFAKTCSDGLGLPLMIGVLSNTKTRAKIRMYEREFGPAAGAFFIYNGKTGLIE